MGSIVVCWTGSMGGPGNAGALTPTSSHALCDAQATRHELELLHRLDERRPNMSSAGISVELPRADERPGIGSQPSGQVPTVAGGVADPEVEAALRERRIDAGLGENP